MDVIPHDDGILNNIFSWTITIANEGVSAVLIKDIFVDIEIDSKLRFESGIFLNDDLDTPIFPKPADDVKQISFPTGQSLSAGETLKLTVDTEVLSAGSSEMIAKCTGDWNGEVITGVDKEFDSLSNDMKD